MKMQDVGTKNGLPQGSVRGAVLFACIRRCGQTLWPDEGAGEPAGGGGRADEDCLVC